MPLEVKAKFDYNSGHEDDLSFTAGQVIKVTEEVDDEWYNGEYVDNRGSLRQGMFPRNFVVPIPLRGTDTSLSTLKREATEATLTGKHPEYANIENPVISAPGPSIVEASSKPAQLPLTPLPNVKSDIGVPVREGQTSQQGDVNRPGLQSKPEKSSSFRDRIAAFNKTGDAPLAPMALPKPTSFVRKPFIPPPPSKESYFTPTKPTQSHKAITQMPPSGTREVAEDADRRPSAIDEPMIEPEISKETLKERILAIQKGLDYTVRLPASASRNEGQVEQDESMKSPSADSREEHGSAENAELSSIMFVPTAKPHPPTEVQDMMDSEKPSRIEEGEDMSSLSKVEANEESSVPEIDPEVARRMALRERMAKMSGGMGMHMAMGMAPPLFSRAKTSVSARPLSPPASPPSEQRDSIPIIPGLPPIKSAEPDREVPITEADDVSSDASEARSSTESRPQISETPKPHSQSLDGSALSAKGHFSSEVELPTSSDEDGTEESREHVDNLDILSEDGNSQEGENTKPASPLGYEKEGPIADTSGSRRVSSDELGPRAQATSNSRASTLESSVRLSRPPPPPPPIPTVPRVSPPMPPPTKFDTQSDLISQPVELDSEDNDSSADSESSSRHESVYSPVSKHPQPPPPPSIPPKYPPASFSKSTSPPPIPPAFRNFDTENVYGDHSPSVPTTLPPLPPSIEQRQSGDQYRYDSHPLPPSPTSTAFRRTQSDRVSLESPRGRVSSERHQREGSYIAMKEENVQDVRQWWLEPNAPPSVFRHRSDLVYEVEDSTSIRRGGHTTVTRQTYVLFSDYSQSIITAQYDPLDPSRAILSQRHIAPPAQPTKSELETRHEQVGHQIGALAQARLGTSVGDGTSLALISEIFGKLENCLPSAGIRSHGALIYSNLGNSSIKQFDEIRVGDIVAFRNAVFQAHGGLRGKVVTEVGKPDHVAIVQEWNGSKKKLKVLEQRQETRRVAHNSYKIGDLKSGEVHVFRPMPRGWVDW